MGNSTTKAINVLPNVLHIKSLLDKDQQLALYNAANEVSQNYTAVETHTIYSRFAEILSLDLNKETSNSNTNSNTNSNPNSNSKSKSKSKSKGIKQFTKFLKKACPVIDSNLLEFPKSDAFSYVTGYVYPQDGKLVGHTDNIPGWVIIVALGSAAKFWVEEPEQKKKEYINFESGDLFVFETSASVSLYHGIDNMVPDSCPSFFPANFQNKRLSLQFRQTITTELVIKPSASSLYLPPSIPHTPNPSSPSQHPQESSVPAQQHPNPNGQFTSLPFMGIPIDVVWQIFSYLDVPALTYASATCKEFRKFAVLDPMWNDIYQRIITEERRAEEEYYNRRKAGGHFLFLPHFVNYSNFEPRLATTTPAKLVKLKTMKRELDLTTVNIDYGTQQTKVGFCGDDAPFVFPSSWNYTDGQIKVGTPWKLSENSGRPIKNQVVQNYEQLADIYEYSTIEKLQILPQGSFALVQLSAYDKPTKQKMCEMFFETLGVNGFYIALNSVLSVYASGRTTGVTVDIGFESTCISVIYEGYSVPELFVTVNIGGDHITKYLQQLILEKHPNLQRDVPSWTFEEFKRKHCYTKISQDSPVKLADELKINDCIIDKQAYLACELLFDPSLLAETKGIQPIPVIVANLIKQYAQDGAEDAKALGNSIILAGYGSMLDGLGERLQKEVQQLLPSKIYDVNVLAAAERGYYPWLGGSILGSLSTFSKMWISRPEYEKSGPGIVNMKCF